LAAELETDDVGALAAGGEVELWDGENLRRPARILGARSHGDRLIVRFEGIESLTQAQQFAGWQMQIPAERRPPVPAGRYYVADLVGCRVTELDSGRLLGRVEGWIETGAVPLLEVRNGEREILIPFAASICVEIDTAGRTIRVRLPEGLEELDRS
jgi:16S rRNA processing protein RimM